MSVPIRTDEHGRRRPIVGKRRYKRLVETTGMVEEGDFDSAFQERPTTREGYSFYEDAEGHIYGPYSSSVSDSAVEGLITDQERQRDEELEMKRKKYEGMTSAQIVGVSEEEYTAFEAEQAEKRKKRYEQS